MSDQPENRGKAIAFAVVLHVVLGAALVLGIQFSDYQPLSGPKVEIVEAEIVTTPVRPRVDPEIERRRQVVEEQKLREAREALEKQRRTETEKAAAEAAEVERRQREQAVAQQKSAAEAKRKAEAETKRKTEAEAQKKAELETRKKAEQAAKRKAEAEAEAQRKAEADRQAREKALQEALAQEQRERELNPLRDAYSAAIAQQIRRNWLRPPGISDDLKCSAMVNQLPDGSVTAARITHSSGNAAFDESVIRAIYKAAPLPQPPNPEVFVREFEAVFCSTEDLKC